MTADFLSGDAGSTLSSQIQTNVAVIAGNAAKGDETPALSLEDHDSEIEGLNRKISVLMAHLHQAQMMLEIADAQIAGQKARLSALEELTTIDDLTGLKNRRGFTEMFQREIEACRRGQSKGGLLIMIDLDQFKALNDTFGHLAGDAALKLVARALIGEIRKTDVAARMGGDEFIVLLTNITKENAEAKARMIASQMAALSLGWNGGIIPFQASTGTRDFSTKDSAETILNAADEAMYASKAEKRSARRG